MAHDDERARRARAQRLHEELEALRAGQPRRPSSPREFLDQQAHRERHAEEREPEDDPPGD